MLYVDGFFLGEKSGKDAGRMFGIALSVVVARKIKSFNCKVDQGTLFLID